MVPAMASRGSFCPPEIVNLIFALTISSGMPACVITESKLASGFS